MPGTLILIIQNIQIIKPFQLIVILFFSLLSATIYAQNVYHVEPGVGTLETAVLSAGAGDILELTSDGEYTLSADASGFATIDFPLTIQV